MSESWQGVIIDMVHRHEKDLYHGNGLPGLTTRMALMEDIVTKISKNLSKIVWLIVGGCITGLGALVFDIIVRLSERHA